jgi:hypothetical protein
MIAPVLVALAMSAPAEPGPAIRHPAGMPWKQLPVEVVCKRCFEQCDRDMDYIRFRLTLAGGWQRQQLLELQIEAARLRTIWYAAWWVTWDQAKEEQRDEWACALIDLVGEDFWTGSLPLPIGCR